MKKIYAMAAAVLLLAPAAAIGADGEGDLEGELTIGGRYVDGENDSAYFNEFTDRDDGLFGSLIIRSYLEDYYLSFEGRNMGINDDGDALDDQSYELRGGDFRNFDWRLFYDEIPHNITFDALTPYTGIGTRFLNLDTQPASTDISTWNKFDYEFERQQYGGQVKVDLNSPFYVKAGAKREERDGLKPVAFGYFFPGAVEMPEPIDYTTDDFMVEGGYRSEELIVRLKGFLSDFDNENLFLDWDNPFAGDFPTEHPTLSTLPPDNEYSKIDGEVTWKALPMSSVLAVGGSYSQLESDFSVADVGLDQFTSAVLGADGFTFNRNTFDGDITYTTASVALTSRPAPNIDTHIFYNFLDKENDSTVITAEFDGNVASNAAELFGYEKNNAGIDVGFELPMETKAQAGYEWLDIERTGRPIVENTTDHIFHVQLVNRSLDFMTGRIRYERVERNADSGEIIEPGVTAEDGDFIRLFLDRFDATDKSKDEIELALSFFVVPNVDLGFEYRYKKNDYDETVIGRTEDTRHEFYGDVLWRLPGQVALSAFGGYEMIENDSTHFNHQAGAGTPPQLANPLVDDGNPDSFIWTQETDDDYWTYGISARMPIMPNRLDLALSWIQQESDGEVDFTTQGPDPLVGVEASDDYDRKLLEAKLIYALAVNTDLTLGYIYEKFDRDDLQFDPYDFTPDAAYLTGAYADLDYEANIGYLAASYRF